MTDNSAIDPHEHDTVAERETVLTVIAATMGFETLAVRGRDAMDFREVGVAQLKRALEAAFAAGRASAQDN